MKRIFIATIIIVIATLIVIFNDSVSLNVFKPSFRSVIIDAGHGYPDGGAQASDGTVESDINLDISKRIYEYLCSAGINCIMTRNSKNSIFTEGETIHAKKVSDIRNRVKIADNNPDALVVSIHMNTFPDSSVKGIQVFYKDNSELAKSIADEIQNVINTKFQADNNKKTKTISSNIYLFNNINNDSVLIECGFLTNDSDLEKLKTEKFRENIAHSISEVILYKLTGCEIDGK